MTIYGKEMLEDLPIDCQWESGLGTRIAIAISTVFGSQKNLFPHLKLNGEADASIAQASRSPLFFCKTVEMV